MVGFGAGGNGVGGVLSFKEISNRFVETYVQEKDWWLSVFNRESFFESEVGLLPQPKKKTSTGA